MSDQRDHGIGGLEWRDLPARTPDEPLVPSTGANGEPADETAVFSAVPGGGGGGTGNERAGDHDGDDHGSDHDDFVDDQDGQHTRRFGVLPMNELDGAEQDGPVDLSALHADDDLLTALVSFDNSMDTADQDPELKALLLSWRLDVDAEPLVELVDTDTAMAAIAVGARIRKRKPRYLVPLASAAAVLVIVFTGMGLAARNAEPGDALWGISQMLYSDHARSVEAAASVRSDLNHASEALEQGHFEEARSALVQAQASLPSVDSEDGKANLQAQQQNLLYQLDTTTGLTPVPPTTGYGATSVSTTTPPAPSTTSPPQQTTPPPATTTQPQQPPPTTTPDITTDQPPPTTTDVPTAPQSGTVGNVPQQPPAQQPALPAGPNSASSSSGSTS